MQHHKIEITADHLTRFASTSPLDAVAELVWNALDADAGKVVVTAEYDVLHSMSAISVHDDGTGIPFSEIVQRFKLLGDSWKRTAQLSKQKGRFLHGKDGQGRFKALSLGRVVEWDIVYEEGGAHYRYTARLLTDDPTDLNVSDAPEPTTRPTGVRVRITELSRHHKSLEDIDAVDRLGERFALYLNQYRDVAILYNGTLIRPDTYILSLHPVALSMVQDGEDWLAVEYDIVEWAVKSERRLYLCDANGFPLAERAPRFHVPGFEFVGYLRSEYFQRLAEHKLIDIDELDQNVNSILEEAKTETKKRYRELRHQETKSVIQQWKDEDVYPYRSEPVGGAAEAERHVFDLVAVSVKDYIPEFDSFSASAKRFNFELLRQAIERNPSELRLILQQVVDLPESKIAELAGLLEDVSLTNIIEASATVTGRLTFIQGLEELIYNDEHSQDLLERAQLHQVIAQNIWIFGEQYSLTVSDKGLTRVLRKHAQLVGNNLVIDRPVKRVDGSVGIVDLMISRAAKPERSGEIEHLIIELKRPAVRLGVKELNQAYSYAAAVANDSRFAVGHAEWEFWVVSAEMTPEARGQSNQAHRPPGLFHDSGGTNPKIRVWARTWSELIQDARVRMQFYKDRLQLEVDSDAAVKKLKRTYAKYFTELEADDVSPSGKAEDGEDEET